MLYAWTVQVNLLGHQVGGSKKQGALSEHMSGAQHNPAICTCKETKENDENSRCLVIEPSRLCNGKGVAGRMKSPTRSSTILKQLDWSTTVASKSRLIRLQDRIFLRIRQWSAFCELQRRDGSSPSDSRKQKKYLWRTSKDGACHKFKLLLHFNPQLKDGGRMKWMLCDLKKQAFCMEVQHWCTRTAVG